jgi:hypothetical protein
MKKLPSLLIILFIFSISWAQESTDSTRTKKLKATAMVSLNSNGIAYVPAFSLDKPAVIGTLSLVKGRFSYDPQLSYSLELRPWIIDNWFHYKLVDRPVFEFKAGTVISSFFSVYETEGEVVHQAQKYLAVEFVSTYKFSRMSSLSFTYLLDRGQDPGTMQGHFFNLQADKSEIKLGKKGLLAARLQLFYIDYNYNNDGLFTAGYISASLRNIPFALFAQAILPLSSNMDPSPEFKWNVGFSYTL